MLPKTLRLCSLLLIISLLIIYTALLAWWGVCPKPGGRVWGLPPGTAGQDGDSGFGDGAARCEEAPRFEINPTTDGK